MADQVDLTPAQVPGLHVHVPAGLRVGVQQSFRRTQRMLAPRYQQAAVVSVIAPTIAKIRFANPS